MARPVILIKPHHFVDIITSFGKGERTFHPHSYMHALHTISERILNDRELSLRIELGIDDICKPCVHNAFGECNDTIDTSYRPTAPSLKNDWNLLLDRRWCDRLAIEQNDQFSAYKLCERIRDKMGAITDIYREIPADRTEEEVQLWSKGLITI